MPLTDQQVEEYTAQESALRKKLESCARDITNLKAASQEALSDPSKVNKFFAKTARASEAKNAFIEAWDRIVLINLKLGKGDTFPTGKESAWRDHVLDEFDDAKAVEISLKAEPVNRSNQSFSDTRSSFQLLDRIKLPTFDGNVKMWARYRDVFTSMVDADQNLGPVTKFYLLRDSLSGEALSVVNKFDITAANYPLAWTALVDTYENKRVLAATYLEQIFSFRMSPKPGLTELQRFLTDVADSVSAFEALKLEAASDKILALAMLRTFDSQTRCKFELAQTGTDFPTCNDIVKFIRNQCQALKLSDSSQPTTESSASRPPQLSFKNKFPKRSSPKYNAHSFVASSQPPSHHGTKFQASQPVRFSPAKSSDESSKPSKKPSDQVICPFCNEIHILARCPTFHGMAIEDRQSFVTKWKGCANCLNQEHKTQDCRSRFSCRFCHQRHHSLLHRTQPTDGPKPEKDGVNHAVVPHAVCGHLSQQDSLEPELCGILGTARATITGPNGKESQVRLLLDTASHQSFITRKLANALHLKIEGPHYRISGLKKSDVAETDGYTTFTINGQHGTQVKVKASVISGAITSLLPPEPIPREIADQFKSFELSDPLFFQPQEVDILIGSNVIDYVVTGLFVKIRPELPSLLPTIFGKVIMGSYAASEQSSPVALFCQPLKAISNQLEEFWKLEEPTAAPQRSPEDLYVEQHFLETHSRTSTGRYMVRLPFATDPAALGSNLAQAKRRFASLETKLQSNDQFSQDYKQFMKDYQELGHMEPAKTTSSYVIPHFGIMQQKLRVVFDASCKSDTTSLNEILLSGPPLQTDIRDVLTLFRLFPIAVTTDIVKMYRQILIHPDDRQYQHVFWREDPSQLLTEYELTTVTYGLTSSPFHALRTIIQLMEDEGHNFPLAVKRIRRRIFVDDITTGADSEPEATELCNQLIQLFKRGGFSLSKWSSNNPSILPVGCTPSDSPMSLQPESSCNIKVLGLMWNPQEDTFSFAINHEPPRTAASKRMILSFISRIFDPLGFLAPISFRVKVLLQQLWKNKLDWDDNLPEPLHHQWSEFIQDWQELTSIRIPRYMHSRHVPCSLVGFCDASEQGYAAVVYLVADTIPKRVHLLTAKTKVAPAKFVSIARLELCGAFLLAKLLSTIDLPDVEVARKTLFSDSTVALAWIHTPSHKLSTFEANRVASIQELAPDAEWRHVRTSENPADIASRGLLPSHMKNSELWWHGPAWLQCPPEQWSNFKSQAPTTPATMHELCSASLVTSREDTCAWMTRFSSFQALLRVTTLLLRYGRRSPHRFSKYSDPIHPDELRLATNLCARAIQKQHWPKGPDTPELSPLFPFTDELGILRVGGRLINAPLSPSAKHQLIIPRDSHFARLIIWDIHHTFYHAGPSLTLAMLRSRFWIPSAMRLIKGLLSKCVTCFRRRPKPHQATMGPLPAARVTPGGAFQQTGVDYAGPITIRDSLRRKSGTSKAYICLFVCMATKALHLELVSSLTTEAFLATLDRFVARRGNPRLMFSDNATNFQGAAKYLKDLSRFLLQAQVSISSHLSRQGVEWRFIPPRSPHFGGLWEAGVKSVKALLRSTISLQPFTFEELTTILTRIESVLNSRPLCPLSESPDSFEPLTPAHFLLASEPSFLPEEELKDSPSNRLSRWQHVQKTVQQIWSRWHREYLNTLQQRTKWKQGKVNLKPNDLVVLLDPANNHVGRWPLARVTAVFPGADGVVRVVTVKTSSGALLKRSIHRLALLPDPSSDLISSQPSNFTQ